MLGAILTRALAETGNDIEASAEILVRVDRQHRATTRHRVVSVRGGRVANLRKDRRYDQDASPMAVVVSAVAERRRLTVRQLMSHGRRHREARWESWYEMRQLRPQPSYPSIGAYFGGLHHTTVMHGVRKHALRLSASTPSPQHGPAGVGGVSPPPSTLPAPADHLSDLDPCTRTDRSE